MLVERVRELTAFGATLDERPDALILRGPFPAADIQVAWLALASSPPAPMQLVQIHDPNIGDDVRASDAFDAGRNVVITIRKPVVEGVALFLFQESVGPYLAERALSRRFAIADLEVGHPFRARGLEIIRWELPAELAVDATTLNTIDPTAFVRDYVPQREVALDLSPWILEMPPAVASPVFAAWEAVAARRLLGGLVSSAWLEEGHVWLQASGPPVYRIRADDPVLASVRTKLTQAATWVFLSGTDVEARHVLFAGELARAHRPAQEFADTLDRALEAAKLSYAAHVQSSSRETLKALADLRKTVIDETQKVAQRAQDLTATLWRDVAVSAAPFVLKILGDAGKLATPTLSAVFYFAAAFFVAVSFILQWRINAAYFRSQAASRQRWMQTLYSYISAREREEIAGTPIEQAMGNYRETRNTLVAVYALLVAALISAGIYTLGQPTSPPAAGSTAPQLIGQPPAPSTPTLPTAPPAPPPTPTPAPGPATVPTPTPAPSPPPPITPPQTPLP